MEVIYSPQAQEDIQFWKRSGDKQAMRRISSLVSSIEKDPFSGIGKPEVLKYDLTDAGPGELPKSIGWSIG